MGGNILGQRFYNNRETPAWHYLGHNIPGYCTAEHALDEYIKPFSVYKQPEGYVNPRTGLFEPTGKFLIVREPIPEDDQWRILGIPVDEGFTHIGLREAAQLWDKNVQANGKPAAVETLGVLGRGERMFISTKLPSLDIKGDEVDTFLLYDNPMVPGNAIGVYTVSTRVVCQNTLNLALGGAVIRKQITHRVGAMEYLGKWMKTIYENAILTRAVMNEAYTILAHKPVNDLQVRWIVDNTYRLPTKPDAQNTRSRRDIDIRLDEWERRCDYVRRLRDTTVNLFNGAGVGMDTPAVKGTAFGAWNAVAEMETYRKGKVTRSMYDGDRAKRIRNGFTLAMAVDQYETVDLHSLKLHRVPA
jgi:hypothetical protein